MLMITWLLLGCMVLLVILALYTSLASNEGAVVTIPLSLVGFSVVLYALVKHPSGWMVVILIAAAFLTAFVLSHATYGMPRPGGNR